jgi:hypothetical protein
MGGLFTRLESNSASLYNVRVMSTQTDLLELRDAAAQAGEVIYGEQLSSLEPEQFGRLVAIHIPSREYFFGDSVIEAADKLRQKYPNAGPGEVYTRRIGEPGVLHTRTPRVNYQ